MSANWTMELMVTLIPWQLDEMMALVRNFNDSKFKNFFDGNIT